MKILLVDDDSFLRDMYATKFAEAGHTVMTAQSGAEALVEYESNGPFEVVLMDMVMPGLSGIDLINELKADKKAKAPKCIVLSNQGEQSDIDSAMEAGAIGYIVKAESIPSEVVDKVIELAK
ncbi:MAG: response regulator [Patescibacteria group bacterium]